MEWKLNGSKCNNAFQLFQICFVVFSIIEYRFNIGLIIYDTENSIN